VEKTVRVDCGSLIAIATIMAVRFCIVHIFYGINYKIANILAQ